MIELSRGDLALLLLVAWMLALGLGALVMGALRPRAIARTVVLFGLFSCLYGARIALNLPVASSNGYLSPYALSELRLALTYVVLLPLMLLVEAFVGRGWHRTMHATVWVQAAYSALGVVTVAVTQLRAPFLLAKPYIVLVIGVAALANIIIASRRHAPVPRMLGIGFAVFLAAVGVFNLALIAHWPALAGVELFGYVVLVGCLAYVVAVYALDTEARLVSIDREMRSAERIQASILPRDMPQISGLAMCARYRPMATMAGDFYDVVRLDDQRVTVIVADVLGHGVPASLIASMVKVAFNAEASHADDPGASLEGMNATLVSVLRESDYVTACYVLIDVATGAVRYGLAGHPPPLLLSPDGTVSQLCEGGTILGQFPAARYSSTLVNAARGSRLLLYTDGVTEAARPDGEFFGVDRLAASLFENRALSAEQYADALLESVVAWRGGGTLEDDVTVVVIDTLR